MSIAQKVTYKLSPALHSGSGAFIDQRCTVQIHQGIRSSRFIRVEMRETEEKEEEEEEEKEEKEGTADSRGISSSSEVISCTGVARNIDFIPLKTVHDASIYAVEMNNNKNCGSSSNSSSSNSSSSSCNSSNINSSSCNSSGSVGIIDFVKEEDRAIPISENAGAVVINKDFRDGLIKLTVRSEFLELEKADTMMEGDVGGELEMEAERTVPVGAECGKVLRSDEGEQKGPGQDIRGSAPEPVSDPERHQDSRRELVLNSCLSQLIVRIPFGKHAASRRITSNVSTNNYHHSRHYYHHFCCNYVLTQLSVYDMNAVRLNELRDKTH